MAKYRSLIRISGNIGDVNLYQADGNNFVRQRTSLTGERIKTDPAFKRTRENMAEFAGAAKASKSLRKGLASVIKRYADSHFGARLGARFQKMIKQAAGIRGQRPVQLATYSQQLEGMPLHRKIGLDMAMSAQPDLVVNGNRNGVTLTLTNLNPDVDLQVPDGASHYKVLLLAVSLSEHVYDPTLQSYVFTNPQVNSLHALDASAELSVDSGAITSITLTATLPNAPVMSPSDSLVVLVGVEFYQLSGSNYYILASGNAMNIVKVF